MADPSALRAGFRANLETIPGVHAIEYVLSDPMTPAVMVDVGQIDYHASMQDGHEVWTWTVILLVGLNSDIGAQKRLDQLLPAVKEAIESDITLGDAADDVIVQRAVVRQFTLDTQTGTQKPPYLGAEYTVSVMA